ncbi:hypothetical protein DEM27_00480 [Metarhizobium album]|uniref:Glycosyltransferase 2-like domain-containing protein n=1 Tax=Metarhizobium album TaxID=2182425 RepID=A0A2U2DWP0_9HYPH|nr:hypothetical protein [Rhizobium album]PWE57721.1 hypothetical protein DEM27_00480 [Rhizobium album]
MTKLSICIPVEPGNPAPVRLATELLHNAASDIEIIVAPYGDTCADADELYALAEKDARLRILPAAPLGISAANLWLGTVAAMAGEWVTVVRPNDILDPDVALFIAYAEEAVPGLDAYGWNSFQIDAAAPRHISACVAIPIQHHTLEISKDDMLETFFQWKDSSNVPKMPFGIYHAAIKRSLLETVLANSGERSWLTAYPQYEWSARVLLYAAKLGFSSRPLSASDVRPYQPVEAPSAVEGFPFNSSIGVTAAIAETQARVLHDLNIEWSGFNDNFIRACMLDCMFVHDETAFEEKAQAYYAAICDLEGGRLAPSFRPPYLPEPQADPRRGLHGRVLLVNRFIGNAVTAEEFFKLVRTMLTPVHLVKDVLDELPVSTVAANIALSGSHAA